MSKISDKNINTLLNWVSNKDYIIEKLQEEIKLKDKEIDAIKTYSDRFIEQINELEKLRSQDLYEKELMLADVDSVVQRSKTIDDRD